MEYIRDSNISPLRYFANSRFVLRIRNATVRIRQMVRTLNAQFCRVPDCVLRISGANLNILDDLNHALASSPLLARV